MTRFEAPPASTYYVEIRPQLQGAQENRYEEKTTQPLTLDLSRINTPVGPITTKYVVASQSSHDISTMLYIFPVIQINPRQSRHQGTLSPSDVDVDLGLSNTAPWEPRSGISMA